MIAVDRCAKVERRRRRLRAREPGESEHIDDRKLRHAAAMEMAKRPPIASSLLTRAY